MTIERKELLGMALIGYEKQAKAIEQQIAAVRAELNGATPGVPKTAVKRHMSAAARKRISMATTKRWREYRRQKAQAA